MSAIHITVFIIAFVSIVLLLYVKQWELTSKRILFERARSKADTFIMKSAFVLKNHVPQVTKSLSRNAAQHAARYTNIILLNMIEHLEKKLAGFRNMIKGRGEVQKGVTASVFLQNVSEHKNNLKEIEPPSSAI